MTPQDKNHIDRRSNVLLRETLGPIVVAIIVGVSSSFVTTYIAVNTLQLKVQYLEKTVDTLSALMQSTNKNEIRLSMIENSQDSLFKRLDKIDAKLDKIGNQ